MEDLKPSSREEAVLAKIAGIEDPMVDAAVQNGSRFDVNRFTANDSSDNPVLSNK